MDLLDVIRGVQQYYFRTRCTSTPIIPSDMQSSPSLEGLKRFIPNIKTCSFHNNRAVELLNYTSILCGREDNILIYVPLYVSNRCINDCLYCGFAASNRLIKEYQKLLSPSAFEAEVRQLADKGYRYIELVFSEDPDLSSSDYASYISIAKNLLERAGGGKVVFMGPTLETADYRLLKRAGVDSVYLWQETYNERSYQRFHPRWTNKGDYYRRVSTFDRVIEAEIFGYGLGFLYGLDDWGIDFLSLIAHTLYLNNEYGLWPEVFGFPRLKPAKGMKINYFNNKVPDTLYKLSVAILKLLFPQTKSFLNTRERFDLITEIFELGGDITNIEVSTYPGGYTGNDVHRQFSYYSYDICKMIPKLTEVGFRPTLRVP